METGADGRVRAEEASGADGPERESQMHEPQRLAQVFVELADTLIEDFDVVDFLQTLTERCVELLGVDAAGLMLTDQRGGLRLIGATLETTRVLELFELQIQEGPCLECYSTGRPITNVTLSEANTRWPAFTPVAVEAGFGATHALPLRLRGTIIGALNLFSTTTAPLSDDDVAVGRRWRMWPPSGCCTNAACTSRPCCPNSCSPPWRAGSSSSRPRGSRPPAPP